MLTILLDELVWRW